MDDATPLADAPAPLPNGHDTDAPLGPVTIRRAQLTDLPRLRVLYQQLCDRFPTAYPTIDSTETLAFVHQLAKAIIDNQPTLFLGVAVTADDAVVGFLAGEVLHRAIGRPNIYGGAHYLVVDAAYRHRGIARALIAAGTTWLAQWPEVTHIELFAVHGDPQWERRGWVPFLVKYATPIAALTAREVDHGRVE